MREAEPKPPLPATVVIVGVLWILGGLLALVTGAGGLAMSAFVLDPPSNSPDRMGDPNPEERVFDELFAYYPVLSGVQIAGALGALAGAIGVLRRKEWARRLVVALSLAGVLLTLSWTLWFGWHFLAGFRGLAHAPPDAGPFLGFFSGFMIVALVMGVLMQCAPFALTWWLARRDDFRRAMAPAERGQ